MVICRDPAYLSDDDCEYQLSDKVLLLGLDGITYSVLDPAFEAGHMPHYKALLDRGVRGS